MARWKALAIRAAVVYRSPRDDPGAVPRHDPGAYVLQTTTTFEGARPHGSGALRRSDAAVAQMIAWLSARSWRAVAALVLLCLALYLPGFATLPVTDRDEGRYAQASTQMLESGDLIDIRFQDDPRYKKPIGIYWLQSASTAVFGEAGERQIWTYRIPSLLGAILAVLATWWAGRPVFGRRAALIGAAMFAACVGMALESRIAKTDAVLILCVVLSQGALLRLYLFRQPRAETVGLAALFWAALGAGILIKGPIAPAVTGLTITALLIFDRDRSWLGRAHPAWGFPMLLLIVLPWFVAIGVISNGEFYALSLGEDFAQKVKQAQEDHWGPPGAYFIAFWWSFWPASLIATGGAAIWLWRSRASRRVLFLFGWVVPFWLVLEVVPTKLPHYIYPVYPALALAAAWALTSATLRGAVPTRTYKQAAALWLFVGLLQACVFAGALWLFATPPTVLAIVLAAIFAVCAPLTVIAAWQRAWHAAIALALVSAFASYTGIIGEVIPRLKPIWISERIAEMHHAASPCHGGPVALSGYREPSAIFHLGTETRLLAGGQVGAWLREGEDRLAFVTERAARRGGFEPDAAGATPLACYTGFNMNGGDVLSLTLYASGSAAESRRCTVPRMYRCAGRPEPRWAPLLK